MSYQKLVRDNIPNIIRKSGEIPITRVLLDEEYKIELDKKLLEECNEVINSNGEERIEELADLLEVMLAILKSEGNSIDNLIKVYENKRKKRGAFDKKIYLEAIEKNNQ